MKFVILAAGKGSRFYPLTQKIPKGLIPLLGKPLLEHVLGPYLDFISEIIFVINNDTGYQIKKHFGSKFKGINTFYVIQNEKDPKGTMSALLLCKNKLVEEEKFIVSNCDDLLLKKDIGDAIKTGLLGIGITKTKMPWNYLGIDSRAGNITGFRRHKKEEGDYIKDYFSNGFHILSPEIFNFEIKKTTDGEMGLPQTLFANLENYPLNAFIFTRWQAVNNPGNLKDAEKFFTNC